LLPGGGSGSLRLVTQRLCPRCRNVVHIEDESTLVFCSTCGAPQVRLSEELRELADRQLSGEAQQGAGEAQASTGHLPPASLADTPWRGAILCAGLAGAIAGVLALLSFAIPPVVLLSVFWFIGAPIVILGIFAARFRQIRITADFGARLGLLCGIAIAIATAALSTLRLLVQRFALHAGPEIDSQMSTVFAQIRSNTEAQAGGASGAAPFLDLLNQPEFRVGLILASAALFLGFYLAYSALAGAFAGYLRSKAPAR
jgi:hypothetical protein